jgi:2,3-bisphosphoglycerate-independent phosphoglycerate mutase
MSLPKFAVILPDGAADEPLEQLGGRTPLEAARKPAMDWIAANGRQGLVTTVPPGFSPGSDVATLSLFGYDPRICYDGRAPLEAAARGMVVDEDQLIFRCNLVTLADGRMADFTAGHIGQAEAEAMIASLNGGLGDTGCRFYTGVSYRNLMVMSRAGGVRVRTVAPHDIPNCPVDEHGPRGPGSERIEAVMARAREILAGHEINAVRRDLGESPVTDIWLWGQGRPKPLEPFATRFGIRGAMIAAVDLIRGIARSTGMSVIDVPGATGYLDTDYAAKGRAAVAALDDFDLVMVHVEAPDEAGHLGDLRAKVTAIERVDEHVVGPVLDALRRREAWRILVAPDHPTPVARRVHTDAPPPFCMAGLRISPTAGQSFGESNAKRAAYSINPGCELMEQFLK